MWKTRRAQDKGEHNIILSRDDLTFVISASEWWNMSATRHVADKALKENKLDFKASEIDFRIQLYYGRRNPPVWTTDLVASGDSLEVHLLRDGAAVAVFGLEEFASLSATKYAVEEAVEEAEGLAVYGRNIKELDEYFEIELGDHEETRSTTALSGVRGRAHASADRRNRPLQSGCRV